MDGGSCRALSEQRRGMSPVITVTDHMLPCQLVYSHMFAENRTPKLRAVAGRGDSGELCARCQAELCTM